MRDIKTERDPLRFVVSREKLWGLRNRCTEGVGVTQRSRKKSSDQGK